MATAAILAIGAAGVGGVYVVANRKTGSGSGGGSGVSSESGGAAGGGSGNGSSAPLAAAQFGGTFMRQISTVNGGSGIQNPYVTVMTGTLWQPLDTSTGSAVGEAAKKIEDEYNKLSDKAKKDGAAAVNAALGTKLTGNESFGEVGAAIGGVGAGAACTATGIGATAAGLCAIAGAYLGKSVGDFVGGVWPDVKDWATGVWDDAKGAVEDAYNSVKFW